jgi:hypothetical protein
VSVATSAQDAVDKHGEDWLAKGFEAARERLDAERLELRTAPIPTSAHERLVRGDEVRMLDYASRGLAVLERRSPALVVLGRDLTAAVLIQLGGGKKDEARRLMLASKGTTLQQRLQASVDSTAEVAAGNDAHARAVDDTLEGLEEAGKLALKAAIPLLLAAI